MLSWRRENGLFWLLENIGEVFSSFLLQLVGAPELHMTIDSSTQEDNEVGSSYIAYIIS